MTYMVLNEQIERYQKRLKCPICNIEEKNAILTKCFHVFCYKVRRFENIDTQKRILVPENAV